MAKSRKFTQYSFTNVVAILNGRQLEGFWEGDNAIEIQPNSQTATPMVGADGATVVSVSADEGVQIFLRVQPNSAIHEYLNEMFLDVTDGNFTPMSFSVRDTRNGEGGSSSQVTIMNNSTKQFGVNTAVREWQLFAANFQWNTQNYVEAVA